MKLISLFLVGLNALMFPAIALAEFDSLENIPPSSISQLDEEIEEEDELTDEHKSKSEEEDEEESEKANEPTPEEIARLKKLATADSLYLSGYKADAVKLYRQAKDIWEIERQGTRENKEPIEIFDDPEQLSPAGKVFWRNYKKGKKQELQSKIFSALKLLTTREPEFISGHLHYAEMLQKYEREAESRKALDRAVSIYPNEPKLVKARIEAHTIAEEWLDASILARQFSLFNPDLPEAQELEVLAEEYLTEYQSNLRSKIALSAIGNAIAGTVSFALTGSLFGPLSALETTSMLLRGESAVGEASVKQAKKQLPLLEDPRITEYVNEIGQKVAAQSGRDDLEYEFLVIMDDSLNAFALPGGKIFVHAGAIMKTDSEAELAGLLAHEVAHAALSHGFQLVTQGNLTANIVSYIPYVGNAATGLIVMNYSRSMERQADIYGTRILVNSGYAADGVRNLMVKLHESHQEDEDNSEPPEWLSTHPNSKARVRYMEELIVDRNLNRFAYEGIARHQSAKYTVTEQWKEYDKCVKDGKIVTVEDARKCIPNQNQPESKEDESKLEEEDLNNEED